MADKIAIGTSTLRLEDPSVFGRGSIDHARQFVRRAMGLAEVRSIRIDPERGSACLGFRVTATDRNAFLAQLSEAVGSAEALLDDADIPYWNEAEPVTLTRTDGIISMLRVIESKRGLLRVAGSGANLENGRLQRMVDVVGSLPGVQSSVASASGALKVRFDPDQLDARALVRAAEIAWVNDREAKLANPDRVPFGVANTTVGLGTVGELMLPVATPVAAGILVVTNLSVARDAAVQLTRGKVGVPMFQTALLACSIVTGQVLAYALTDWSLRYWQRRWRRSLAKQTRLLLSETFPMPEQTRRIADDGKEKLIPAARLSPGDRIRVGAAEAVPVDGQVISGAALVDESRIRGSHAAVRKSVGDPVWAGSSVLAGALDLVAERLGADTSAARMAAKIVEVTAECSRDRRLQQKAEQLADKTVLPTFATAGVGWVAGDLITVGAILHQDWISGPALAVPLLTLQGIRSALDRGALMLSGTALQRLAESDFVVLDGDHPALASPMLELAELQSQIPDVDAVLRHTTGAGVYLGDERSVALANACRERGLVVRQPALSGLGPGRVDVSLGEHQIRLLDIPSSDSNVPPGLKLEIDGRDVAHLTFRFGQRLQAAYAVERLRAAGLQTFLLSSSSDARANELARRLGTDMSGGELDAEGRVRFLQGLRRRGVKPIYVGPSHAQPEIAAAAHVFVGAGGLNGSALAGDVLLLGAGYDALADVVALSRDQEPSIVSASRMATVPNLLCIAGAFGGVLNGITAGIIANVGVMNVDRRLHRTLGAASQPKHHRKLLGAV